MEKSQPAKARWIELYQATRTMLSKTMTVIVESLEASVHYSGFSPRPKLSLDRQRGSSPLPPSLHIPSAPQRASSLLFQPCPCSGIQIDLLLLDARSGFGRSTLLLALPISQLFPILPAELVRIGRRQSVDHSLQKGSVDVRNFGSFAW